MTNVSADRRQLPYIHLTSTQRFPQLGQLTEDQAVDYLLQAPRIVRDMAPMVWQIINPPPDGTLFLTWQPPNLRKHMASDGYVWADPENTFHFERHGFVRAKRNCVCLAPKSYVY